MRVSLNMADFETDLDELTTSNTTTTVVDNGALQFEERGRSFRQGVYTAVDAGCSMEGFVQDSRLNVSKT